MDAIFNYAAFSGFTALDKSIHIDEVGLIETIRTLGPSSVLYHCLYNLEARDSFAKYNGKAALAFGRMIFDFDSHDGAVEAFENAKRFCAKLEQEKIDHRIYFSGSKGFHVDVPAKAFGLDGEHDSQVIKAKVKGVLKYFKQAYPTLDLGIYTPNHKIRAFRSRHEKTGLYKIELPKEDFSIMSLDIIKHMSKNQPDNSYYPHFEDAEANDWAISITNSVQDEKKFNFNSEEKKDYSVFENFRNKRCIKDMQERILPQENRHDIGLRIINDLKLTGITRKTASKKMKEWAEMAYGEDSDAQFRIEDTERMVADAYNGKIHSFGCYDDIKKKYCSAYCTIFNKLDKDRRAQPLDTPEPQADNARQIGFYFEYIKEKSDGTTSVKYVPQYQLMADNFLERKAYCFDDSLSLKFDGKKWEWLTSHDLQNIITRENKDCIQPNHIDQFAKAIKSTCFTGAMGVTEPEGLINVSNGVVEIKTGKVLPHSYKYMFKYCANADYDVSATCPTWEKFLLDTFCGNFELIDLAQRLFGYVLVGGRPFLHKAFVLYGSGRNGKSTFLDVLKAVIGKDGYSVVGMSKLDREFSLVRLDGMLANIAEETPNDEINAEVFKTLVGGGEITASHKGMDEYQFQCNARFIFACNDMPVFRDKSVGLEDRLIFIPFERYIKQEDRDTEIVEKLLAELPGILNWSIYGAKVVLKDRFIPDYEATTKAKETYKEETDPLYAWFKDNIEVAATSLCHDVSTMFLYSQYTQDCSDSGHKPFSIKRFGTRLRDMVHKECKEKGIEFKKEYRFGAKKERGFDVVRYIGTGSDRIRTDSIFRSGPKNYN